jgi:hypothetical protein
MNRSNGFIELRRNYPSRTAQKIPLEVPAEAEIVIEGEISVDQKEAVNLSAISGLSHGRKGVALGPRGQGDHDAPRRNLHGDSCRAPAE